MEEEEKIAEDKVVKEAVKLRLLLLDDEQDIINSLTRLFRKEYQIITFNDGNEALGYLAKNDIDLIMSDMRMPKMNGANFLSKSRKLHPHAIRLLLTGFSDMESTIKAINEGGVYTYACKPWDNQELKITLSKAAEHYLLKKEIRELGEKNTKSTVKLAKLNQSLETKVAQRTEALIAIQQKLQITLNTQNDLLLDALDMMSATIEYRTGLSAGNNKRIATQCKFVAKEIGLKDGDCHKIYLCALLHEIGTIGLSDEVLSAKTIANKAGNPLSEHPVIGAEIVGRVKRFAPLTPNILHQNENYNGTGFPNRLAGDEIPIGARIIRVVKDFNYLIAGKSNNKKMPISNAHIWMNEQEGIWYDKKILNAFTEIFNNRDHEDDQMEYCVGLDDVKPGVKLLEDLVLDNGNVMLKAGQEINEAMLEKLRVYEKNHNTKMTLFIA
jgi:response regulator RpfG family c-di-GMP phosphodiesterase